MRKVRRLLFFGGTAFLFICAVYIFNSVLQSIFDARNGVHIISEIDNFGKVHKIPLRNFNPDVFLREYSTERNQDHGYNVNRSLLIPWNRTLNDQRPQRCKRTGKPANQLPTASIIIEIQNEAASVILRMVISILRQTPPSLLREIILVVDFSGESNLSLESLSTIPKVSVYSHTKRKGTVASLLFGAEKATGDVLVLWSEAGEVTSGWLEPLLERIHLRNTVVVNPVIDFINSETFDVEFTGSNQRAVFDWGLSVKWQQLTSETTPRVNTEPIVTPVSDGKVMAVDRKRFMKLGGADPGLENWGAAGLELSLKFWMCGGTVEIIPCSHVSIIKKRKPRTTQKISPNSIVRDLRRVAEVWLDGYKRYFYVSRPAARMTSHGSVADRRKLRGQLRCQSFKWYLDSVLPQLKPLSGDDFMYGRIRQGGDDCMDIALGHVPVMASLSPCSEEKNSQEWTWKSKGMIKNYGMCLTADPTETHGYVLMQYCNGASSQLWFRQDNMIVHEVSKLCIDSHKAEIGLVLSECDGFIRSQRWMLPNPDSV
ncbi:polypeptide N-acetylgalactosaminyltransferase 2-like [Crassostrea virginica]